MNSSSYYKSSSNNNHIQHNQKKKTFQKLDEVPDDMSNECNDNKPTVCILREVGSNGHREMIAAFFHAGFESFSRGFLGVDIFFVISGYLITKIIIIALLPLVILLNLFSSISVSKCLKVS